MYAVSTLSLFNLRRTAWASSGEDYDGYAVEDLGREARFNSGWVTTAITTRQDAIRALALTTDNKLVAVGRSSNGSGFNDFVIARYWADGSLDSNFDGDGIVVTSFAQGEALGHALSIDTLGRYVVAGRRWGGSNFDFGVSRYNTNGAVDTTFGTSGHVTIGFTTSSHEFARAVGHDSRGRIIVAGYSNVGTNGRWDFALARLTTTGALDTGFSGDGLQITNFTTGANWDNAYALLIDTLDKPILGGLSRNAAATDRDFALARYLTNGTLDTTYSTDGLVTQNFTTDDEIWGMTFDDQGRVAAIGRSANGNIYDMRFARYTTAGANSANVAIALNSGMVGRAIAFDTAQQRYIAAGHAWNGTNWNMTAVKISQTPAVDTSFDTDGISITTVTTQDDDAWALVFNGNQIYSGGRTDSNTGAVDDFDFVIVRYNSSGSVAQSGDVDENWDADGSITVDFLGDLDSGEALSRNPVNGRYVVAGSRRNGANDTRDFALVRFLSSGTLDTTFGTAGLATVNFATERDEAHAAVHDSTGRVTLAGFRQVSNAASRDFALARFTTGGVLDTTFGTAGLQTLNFNTDDDEAYGLVIDTNGRYIAGGFRENGGAATRDFALARFTTAGALDTTYGTGGRVVTDFVGDDDEIMALALDTLGRTVAAGFSEDGNAASRRFALARYTTGGVLDTTFGTAGLVTTNISAGEDIIYGLVIDSLGKIVVAGISNDNVGVARYLTTGAIDTSFGVAGLASVDNGGTELGEAVGIQDNGKIVISGETGNNIMVVRLTSLGAADTTFDGDGRVVFNPGGNDDGKSLYIDTIGRYVIGGRSGNDFLGLRMWQ